MMTQEYKILNLTPVRQDLLKRCIEADRLAQTGEYPLGFTSSDIPCWPGELKALEVAGLLKKSRFSSNRHTYWWVKDIDEVEKAIGEIEAPVACVPQFVPEDLFSLVIGYEDVKELILGCLDSKPVHLLFVGPPACAKTLFLMELERLPGAMPCLGSSSTKVGILDLLMDYQPKVLVIDEERDP